MIAYIQKWLAAKGGTAHVVAAAYLFTIAAYAGVPAFAGLLNSFYALLPSTVHELILAVLGIVAWYTNMRKSPAA
jgi:hypothetical protein